VSIGFIIIIIIIIRENTGIWVI